MNSTFRNYAFGRAFRLDLSERHTEALAALCQGTDPLAAYGLGGSMNGLLRRGLVEIHLNEANHRLYRPTKAGLLVYALLVEAGEFAALEKRRQETLEKETELHRLEWEERFGQVEIKLKEAYLRHPVAPKEVV